MASNISSKKYLDYAGLSYFKQKLDELYATQHYVDSEDRVLRAKFDDYLPLTGGELTGQLYVNLSSTDKPSYRINKSGSYYTGIGYHGTNNETYFGATDYNGDWVSSLVEVFNFGGSIKENGTLLSDKYLEKLPFEWNKNINFGSSGYLLIGKFPMYDSNITIDIDSTTSETYHATLVIATQNINTSRGGSWKATVYGDALNTVAPLLKIKYSTGSNVFEVYFSPQAWSKNLIHIRATGLAGAATNICESVSSLPSTDLIDIINALTSNFLSNSGGTLTGNLTMDTSKKINLSGAGINFTAASSQPSYIAGDLSRLGNYLYLGTDGTSGGVKRLAYYDEIPSLTGYATETWVEQNKIYSNYQEVIMGPEYYSVTYDSATDRTIWTIGDIKWEPLRALILSSHLLDNLNKVYSVRGQITVGDLNYELQLMPVMDYNQEGEAIKKLRLVSQFPAFDDWGLGSRIILNFNNKTVTITNAQMDNNMWEFYRIKLYINSG